METPFSSHDVHVNVLTGGWEGHRHAKLAPNPMLDSIVRDTRCPKFSGKQAEYSKFKREWGDYIELMRVASPAAVTEPVMLFKVLLCIPDYLGIKVKDLARELGATTSIRAVWRMLDEIFARIQTRWAARNG